MNDNNATFHTCSCSYKALTTCYPNTSQNPSKCYVLILYLQFFFTCLFWKLFPAPGKRLFSKLENSSLSLRLTESKVSCDKLSHRLVTMFACTCDKVVHGQGGRSSSSNSKLDTHVSNSIPPELNAVIFFA